MDNSTLSRLVSLWQGGTCMQRMMRFYLLFSGPEIDKEADCSIAANHDYRPASDDLFDKRALFDVERPRASLGTCCFVVL